MNKKSLRGLLITLSILMVGTLFTGCAVAAAPAPATTPAPAVVEITGSITVAGSTALQPLAEQAGKVFTDENTKASINVQGGGSGTGLNLVSQGTAEIGMSDVAAETKLDATKSAELVDHKVAVIGFAMVTNKDVTVKNLKIAQIQDIFSGVVTNWKAVGGADEKINVINRTKSSGTRATFKDTVLGKDKNEKDGLGTSQDSSGAAEKAVEATKGAITYLAMSYLTDEIKAKVNVTQIEGVDASAANITSKKYPFWSFEHMYTKGEAKDLSKAFIDYMMSADNKDLISKLGYISASDIQ